MTKLANTPMYREHLPQLDRKFLTDGGLETTLIFHEGWELPYGEAFVLLENERGSAALRAYFDRYTHLATDLGVGFVLESPTWRANPDWAKRVGVSLERLERANRFAIELMAEIRATAETHNSPMPISGCVGPRGDGYDPGIDRMSAREAQRYHAWQVGVLANAGADFVSAITMTSIDEGLGVAMAAKAADLPSVISFTLETDGRLPTGETLAQAITTIDRKTGNAPAYYMINCAHPTHFEHVLAEDAPWMIRIGGLRANSSKRSHQELDNAPELDIGNPAELGQQYRDLVQRFPHINVLGGCCGTDHRHVGEIGRACLLA